MKKKNSLIALLLLLTLVLSLILTSCGGTEEEKEDTGSYDGSAVTIKFYHTMGQNLSTVLDQYIVEFNKLYPNIKVEWEQVGGYNDVRDQITKELTVGNEPNLAYCYPDHVALYNKSGKVVALDSLIANTNEVTRADGTTEIVGFTAEQIADFIPAYYEEGRQYADGKMYTLPFAKSTEVLYYNKTFFEEHNLSVPTTWDEMEAVCAAIKEIDPDSIPLGYDSESNWFITMCEQYGSAYTSASGEHYLFDNATNQAFVKKFNSWYQQGYVITQELYGAYTSGLFVSTETQKSYMSIGSSAGATHQRPTKVDGAYPFEVGIAQIPQVDVSNPKVISQGPSVCIFKKSNPQEVYASWLFAKFLTTSIEFQADFSRASGYIPVIKSASTDPSYAQFLSQADGGDHIAALSTKIGIEMENAYYTSPAFVGSSDARDAVGSLLTACLILSGQSIDAEIDEKFKEAIDTCRN